MSVESKWELDLISLLERWIDLKLEVKRSVICLILPASPSAFDGSNLHKLLKAPDIWLSGTFPLVMGHRSGEQNCPNPDKRVSTLGLH